MTEQPVFTPVAEMSYTKAITELEEIMRRMQSDALDLDLLTTYTRRATELLAECRRRLTATDEEVRAILS